MTNPIIVQAQLRHRQEHVLRCAAYLAAVMADRRYGIRLSRMSEEMRDAVVLLTGELDGLGLLKPYREDDGSLSV
jgi:hypothetical protein